MGVRACVSVCVVCARRTTARERDVWVNGAAAVQSLSISLWMWMVVIVARVSFEACTKLHNSAQTHICLCKSFTVHDALGEIEWLAPFSAVSWAASQMHNPIRTASWLQYFELDFCHHTSTDNQPNNLFDSRFFLFFFRLVFFSSFERIQLSRSNKKRRKNLKGCSLPGWPNKRNLEVTAKQR